MSNLVEQRMFKQMDYFWYNKKLIQILASSVFIITATTILQDFLHSRLNNYSFYFSESLLFKTFWFLFLPLLFFQLKFLRNSQTKNVLWTVGAVLVPILVHLLLTPLVVFVVSAVFYSHTFSYYQTLAYTASEDVYKLLLIYGLAAVLSKNFFVEEPPKTAESPKTQANLLETIVVSNGRNYIPISVGDILYLSAATPYVSIQLENKQYLHTETLKSIKEKLDKTQFVRIHKSTIVNLKKVVSYKSRLNGDYDLLIENGTKIRLSRNYSVEFKEHFKRQSTG